MVVDVLDPPGPLQVERMPDGRRRLVRDLCLKLGKEKMLIRKDFKTDYSHWPRYPTYLLGIALIGMLLCGVPTIYCVVATVLMLASIAPRFSKTDIAGVVHDFIWRHATLGSGGRPVGYFEGNKIWYEVARSGNGCRTKTCVIVAAIGFTGLTLCAWCAWCRYRRAGKRES